MKNEKFLSCNNKIESRIVYFRSFSPYVIIIIFHWDIKWCVSGKIYNSYTLINANETCKTFWWLRFRSDLSTFGILTMAKYYVFISFERWKSSHVVDEVYLLRWPNSIFIRENSREREKEEGSSFENKFNCETNATESFITRPSRNVPVFFFFLNLIQVSQNLTLFICSF